jgi:hypothetical protein
LTSSTSPEGYVAFSLHPQLLLIAPGRWVVTDLEVSGSRSLLSQRLYRTALSGNALPREGGGLRPAEALAVAAKERAQEEIR